jgi:hypothetical protein
MPPLTLEFRPLASFKEPPLTLAPFSLAVFCSPPLMVDF